MLTVRLSDPSRLHELCGFFRQVHALAEISGEALTVQLVGASNPREESRQLHAYVSTWLALYGRGVEAELEDFASPPRPFL